MNNVTIVSCYYKIKSKFSNLQYMNWIKNFIFVNDKSDNFRSVIFCDEESYNNLSLLYPETDKRRYVKLNIENFTCNVVNWDEQHILDPERDIHSPDLYRVWNEKPYFIKRAIEMNVYNTEYFLWMDIGVFREEEKLLKYTSFPNVNAFSHDKLLVSLINEFDKDDVMEFSHGLVMPDDRFNSSLKNHIAGGFLGGRKELLQTYSEFYYNMLLHFKYFKGKDQILINFLVLLNHEMFDIIHDHNWFYMLDYLSLDMYQIHIQRLKTIFISPDIGKYEERKRSVEKLLYELGFNQVEHYKSGTQNYPVCVNDATVNILSSNLDQPIILLEDDIECTGYFPKTIYIPQDADAIYIGLSMVGGHLTENTHIQSENIFTAELINYNHNLVKVNNMLSAHAIIYLTERYKNHIINLIKQDNTTYSDIHMSRSQPNFNIYALKTPIFFQNDGNILVTNFKIDFQ